MRVIIDSNNPDDVLVETSAHDPPSKPPALHIDLANVTEQLRQRLAPEITASYVRGKTRMRDEVMDMLECSLQRAEQVVDSLVALGHTSFHPPVDSANDSRLGTWNLRGKGGGSS